MSKINLHEMFKARMNEQAKSQRIYEPKYGGKDHSGYDTMMKYEINDEREECFELGYTAALNDLQGKVDGLLDSLQIYMAWSEGRGSLSKEIVDEAYKALAEFKNGGEK